MMAWEKQCMLGLWHMYEAKPVHNEEKKMPQSKYAQKISIHAILYTHTHIYVEIFLSLRSAAISSVSLFLCLLSECPDLIGAPGCGPITVRHQSHHATSSECFWKAGTHTHISVACVPS